MRLVVIDPLLGTVGLGAAMSNADLARDLAARGHEVMCPLVGGCVAPPGTIGLPCKIGGVQHFVEQAGADAILCGRSIGLSLGKRARAVPLALLDDGGVRATGAFAGRFRLAIVKSENLVPAAVAAVGRAIVVHSAMPAVEGSPLGDCVVLPAGNLQKGIDVLAAVAPLLPDLRFVAVDAWGDGGRPDLVRHLPNVTWFPQVLLPGELLRMMRVCLFPSRSEIWPVAPRLAALHGRAVVARRIPGTVDALGDAALWVDGDDAGAWAAAVRSAWTAGAPPAPPPRVDRGAEIDALIAALAEIAGQIESERPISLATVPAATPEPPVLPVAQDRLPYAGPAVTPGSRPTVALLSDVRGWAFHRNMLDLEAYLSGDFNFVHLFVGDGDFPVAAPPVLRLSHAVFVCYHAWGVDNAVPLDRAIGAVRSSGFRPPPGPEINKRDPSIVNGYAAFQVVTRAVEAALRPDCPRVVYLTNPVDCRRHTNKTRIKDVVAAWAGNAAHARGEIVDQKGIASVIRPACAVAGVPLVEAEYGASRLDPDAMPDFYRKASVYLCASLYEGASNSVMEAMASGLAVIATDVGNHREIMESELRHQGDTGIVLCDRTPEAFAAALSALKADPGRVSAMGKSNSKEIRDRWSWSAWKDRYRDVLLYAAGLGPFPAGT